MFTGSPSVVRGQIKHTISANGLLKRLDNYGRISNEAWMDERHSLMLLSHISKELRYAELESVYRNLGGTTPTRYDLDNLTHQRPWIRGADRTSTPIYAKTFLRQESECLPRYEMVCVPGDHGRTERLRLYLRDLEYSLRGIPEDRRMIALTHITAVLVKMWYQADYHVVDHARLMGAAKMFFVNRANKGYLIGVDQPSTSPEDDLEARRIAA